MRQAEGALAGALPLEGMRVVVKEHEAVAGTKRLQALGPFGLAS